MQPSRNGYRRAVATILAAVTLGVLVGFALAALAGKERLSAVEAVVLVIFLGLHSFAVTWLLGQSPWPDIVHVLELLAGGPGRAGAEQKQPPDHRPGTKDQA
jgi:hypothetical protein